MEFQHLFSEKFQVTIEVVNLHFFVLERNVMISLILNVLQSKAPFTRDQIQMGSDAFRSDPLFEGRLQGIGSILIL